MDDVGTILAQAQLLHRAGRYGDAEQLYRQLLQADPEHVDTQYFLAAACDAQGRGDEAMGWLGRLLVRAPRHPEARNHLGAILAERGQLDDAIVHFETALESRPNWPDAAGNLRNAIAARHGQRGLALTAEGKLDEAAASFRSALAIRPDDAAALGNLGNALKMQGKVQDAADCYRRVLQLTPRSAEAHFNLGSLMSDQARWEEAAESFRKSIELKPQAAQAYCGLGRTHLERANTADALACYRRAVELAPDSADAHFHLAFALLLTGELAEGWRHYEWRLKTSPVGGPAPLQPLWTGTPLAGRTILVRCEQGFGDSIQFIRLAELLKGQGATVSVECQPALASLLASAAGVDRVVPQGKPRGEFDFHVPHLSLPGLLGTTLENIPARVPYLAPDTSLVELWKARLGHAGIFKVGIVWQGAPIHSHDRFRSFRLSQFAGIARMPGVQLYSLQVGPGREQLSQFAAERPVVDLGGELDDFQTTAAVMRNLDLVITCDSSPCHLAGALGVPVWVALARVPDWRWLLDRDDSPWYPTMRLFRQTNSGDWDGVFRRIEREVAGLVSGRGIPEPWKG